MSKSSTFFGREMKKGDSFVGKPLGIVKPEDELLHPPGSDHYAGSETSYYGFSIPEAKINAEIYIWFHPNLRVLSAGVFIWRGMKATTSAAEYVNYFGFLPFPTDGIASYRIEEIGLSIKVVEALHSIEIEMEDADQSTQFSLMCTAIMPPAVRPDGCHFTQAMKTAGELTLHGDRFTIDGFFSRDRSWGHPREETRRNTAPLSWSVGVINEHLAFHSLAFDDPALKPTWLGAYPEVTPGNNLIWGYIFRDGVTTPLSEARQLTHRDKDGISVSSVDLELVDTEGNALVLVGEVQARLPWNVWQNNNVVFAQTRWTCSDGIGYGDVMDNLFSDFTYRFS